MSALYLALSKAQAEFETIELNCTAKVQMKNGGTYEFDYADLEEITKKTRKALVKNEIAVTNRVSGGQLIVELLHSSGEKLESSLQIRPTDRPQDLGSQLTYFRRYLLAGLLGVTADSDDDGNLAEGNDAKIEKKQAAKPKKEPIVPGANLVSLKNAGEYKCKFGKSKGKTLSEMGVDSVVGMITFIKHKADEKFRDSEQAKEFLFFADQFLRTPGNQPDELDMALKNNKPEKTDVAPPPDDWANEPFPEWDGPKS